jgi:hypothetical protein
MSLSLPKTSAIVILCVVVLALVVLSLALAAHWFTPAAHIPAALGVIPHPWGCGGGSTAC